MVREGARNENAPFSMVPYTGLNSEFFSVRLLGQLLRVRLPRLQVTTATSPPAPCPPPRGLPGGSGGLLCDHATACGISVPR